MWNFIFGTDFFHLRSNEIVWFRFVRIDLNFLIPPAFIVVHKVFFSIAELPAVGLRYAHWRPNTHAYSQFMNIHRREENQNQ